MERNRHDDPPASRAVSLPVEDVLDLHPFRPREIPAVVESFLEAAREAGFDEVRLVHGRGIGVQRHRVRAVLARHPDVIAYGDAPPERGGWGATVVRLRRRVSGGTTSI
ncbi:MAG: Smr/MutS family protein [Acidobacteriota bacterium]